MVILMAPSSNNDLRAHPATMHNLCAHLLPASAQVRLHRLCTASTNQLWQQLVHQLPDTCSHKKSAHSSRQLKGC